MGSLGPSRSLGFWDVGGGLKDAEPLWKGLGLGDRWREVLETGSWLRGWEKRFGTEVESREGERRVPGIAAMGEGKGW